MEFLDVSVLVAQFERHPDAAKQIQILAQKLNRQIDEFNSASDRMEKRQILHRIFLIQQSSDEWLSPRDIIAKPLFKEIFYKSLYFSIQKEFESLGVFSLDRDSLEKSLQTDKRINRVIHSLPQLISRLSDDKIDALASELAAPNAQTLSERLNTLFTGWDEPYAQRFLETHTMEFLGEGKGNSKNVRVTNMLDESESLVLKLENNLGHRKSSACERIRRSADGKNLLVRRDVARHASYRAPGGREAINTLCVEEYCSKGSLLASIQRVHDEGSTFDIQRFAAQIYFRMAEKLLMLENVGKKGVFFPDMKNSNWLMFFDAALGLEGALDLRLADTKALVSAILSNGRHRPQAKMIRTPVYSPPEFEGDRAYPIDTAHSFMMGMNLYQALTNATVLPKYMEGDRVYPSRSSNRSISSDEYFTQDVFQNEVGQAFKNLIQGMLQKDPRQRPSVEAVLEFLSKIDNTLSYKAFEQLQIEAQQDIVDYASALGLFEESRGHFKASILYYKDLIQRKASPSEVMEFKKEVMLYVGSAYKKDLIKTLNKIKQGYQLGSKDKKMIDFYNEWKKRIEETPPDIQMKHDLNELLETFKNNPRLNEIVRNFREFKEEIQDVLVAEAQYGSIEDRVGNEMFEGFSLYEAFDFNQYKDKYQSMQPESNEDKEEMSKKGPK